MTRSSPNPVPDAPGLVEYRGLDAVAEAHHYPSRLDIRTVEYDSSPERAEQYLAAGGNPENVRFRRGIDPEAEDAIVLEQLRKVPDSFGDAAWLETFEQDIELGMDVLLACVERLVTKGVLELPGTFAEGTVLSDRLSRETWTVTRGCIGFAPLQPQKAWILHSESS